MAETSTSGAASLALSISSDLLADMELNRTPLNQCFMKGARLARVLNDAQYLAIFQYEVSGYPTTPNGITPEVWALCKMAGRVTAKINEDDGSEKEFAFTDSVEELESRISTQRQRLDFFQPQPVSITSANPNQYVSGPYRNLKLEAEIAASISNLVRQISSRRAFLYSYTLQKNSELQFSSASENVFQKYRKTIDSLLGSYVPDELKRIDSISANLQSANPEDWANAVHSCRRLLQSLSDCLFPPTDKVRDLPNRKKIKLGPDNYINRLICFCEDAIESDRHNDIIGSELKYFGERLDAAFRAAQKGSHATVSNDEAGRYVIHTYLIVGDILQLADSLIKSERESRIIHRSDTKAP